MARRIIVLAVASQSVIADYDTNARTWGDVKREKPEVARAAHGMTPFYREGRINIGYDDFVLPSDQDISIYLQVDKQKSGADPIETAIRAFVEELSQACIQ